MRLEWRPSRWLVTAQRVLGLLAAWSLVGSEMPHRVAYPLAMAAIAGGAWQARRLAGRPHRWIVWPAGQGAPQLDGVVLRSVELHWRGPLAFLHWRDATGKAGRLSWWPDTLPAPTRRELRLAARPSPAAQARASMAP